MGKQGGYTFPLHSAWIPQRSRQAGPPAAFRRDEAEERYCDRRRGGVGKGRIGRFGGLRAPQHVDEDGKKRSWMQTRKGLSPAAVASATALRTHVL